MRELLAWIEKLARNGFKVEITLKNIPENRDFIRELQKIDRRLYNDERY